MFKFWRQKEKEKKGRDKRKMSSFILTLCFLILLTSNEMDFAHVIDAKESCWKCRGYLCLVLLWHPKLRYQIYRPVKTQVLSMKPGQFLGLSLPDWHHESFSVLWPHVSGRTVWSYLWFSRTMQHTFDALGHVSALEEQDGQAIKR